MSDPLCILAGTHEQFLEWCREHDQNPNDKKSVIYATESSVRGRYFSQTVLVGTFWDRKDASAIHDNVFVR